SSGPLIVAGIGKSGHVANKIASTFRSIGKAAIFLHPGEASHGDLGLITEGSVLLILSNSGETNELSDLLAFAQAHGTPIIALTSDARSTLARAAAATIAYGKVAEADPNGLAPTTSTTLSLAIGDALAIGVTRLLGTAPEDFRRYHPGGKLGAMLLDVADLMHRGDALPVVTPDTEMSETVVVMSEKALGVAVVVEDGRVSGIITDGDMRRHAAELWTLRAGEIATPAPFSVDPEMRATDALAAMTDRKITAAIVLGPDKKLVGLLHMHDILRAGVGA
ncbi:MAG: KpsF/GutQ family sugar-phosphate isomerase, partial [Pseudomonadota bacterium]